ncbi:Uncharacterized protein HZ326_9604 [Fusarium oxysporum f. sp. albedinis]|nr:Uncharacterized protein HZ326_9604 [Fusarium oxysporum f. sp. albedinis]
MSVAPNNQSMVANLVHQGHTWRDSAKRTVHMDAINRSEASETIAVSIYHVNRGLKLRYHRDGHYQVRA